MLGKLKFLGEILIVTVSAYYLGVAAYLLVKPVDIKLPDTGADIVDVSPQAKADRPQFEIINIRNLFAAFDPAKVVHKPKPKPKPVQKDLDNLPVVATTMRLMGTIYASDPILRRAVVSVNGAVQVAKAGENVLHFKIAEIKRRAVVLESGGKREIMMIDQDDKVIALKSDSGRVMLDKKKFQQVLANPNDILSKIDFAPAKLDGKKGLLINGIEKDSLLAGIGVQKGDLIVSVNGKELSSFQDLMNLAKMAPADSVEIKIWRKKRFETLSLKLRNA